MIFTLILIAGVLIPVVSVSLNQLQASPESWEHKGYSNCTICHTRYLPATKTFTAAQTVNTVLCRNCHDTIQFGALSTKAEDAHYNHLGLMGADRPQGGSKGTASKHPKLANLIRTVDFGECSACHRSLAGGLAGWNCTSCHDPATTAHIKTHINSNCSICHGALPTITYHTDATISAGNHSVLGSGRYGCFACHNNQTTGIVGYRLANGTTISFDRPSELCWQCHSDYYKDWKAGNHQDSSKQCTDESCHNPHAPYLPRAAAPTQAVGISPTLLFGAAIAVVVIIAVALYLLKRR